MKRQIHNFYLKVTRGEAQQILVDPNIVEVNVLNKCFADGNKFGHWNLYGRLYGDNLYVYRGYARGGPEFTNENDFHDYVGTWLNAIGFSWQILDNPDYLIFWLIEYEDGQSK